MTYEKGKQGYRTVMGNSPEECVNAALEHGADIIGANCGTGVDAYVDLAIELKNLSDRPLWIKGNAGLPEIVDGQTTYRMSAEDYGSHVERLLSVGVNIIGGCCGTGPEYIAVMRSIIDKWNK
jgi:5-methyltetrahydrofolate--homocysteine methyltransferase